jgi:hypothetical protein
MSHAVQAGRFHATLKSLNPAPGQGIVVVDFVRFTANGSLGGLLRSSGFPHRVDLVDAVSDLTTAAHRSIGELAEAYGEAILRSGHRPSLIAAFCSASRLGLKIADHLAASFARPRVVLVEPSWPDDTSIATDLQNLYASIGGEGQISVCADLPTADRLTAMCAILERRLRTLVAGDDPDEAEDVVAGLLGRYRAWLSFVLATRDDELSAGPDCLILGAGADEPTVHNGATIVRLRAASPNIFTDGTELLGELARLASG